MNTKKTKIMIFEKGRKTHYDFFLYNTKIEITESFKYLGVHLFKNGNWNRTQKRIAQHASYSLHNLFTIYNQLDLPISQKVDLFDSLVLPTLNYSAEVWGHHACPNVESIFLKFCRKILCVKKHTNLNVLYGELGRIPMHIHRKLIMIKYWIKLISLNRESILFKTYKMLKTYAENGFTYNGENWAYIVKSTLNTLGLSYIWENQSSAAIYFNQIKQRALDIFHQSWYYAIINSSRLETYCLFKCSSHFEQFLDSIKESKFRNALTQFRASSHALEIEQGRHNNIQKMKEYVNNAILAK